MSVDNKSYKIAGAGKRQPVIGQPDDNKQLAMLKTTTNMTSPGLEVIKDNQIRNDVGFDKGFHQTNYVKAEVNSNNLAF